MLGRPIAFSKISEHIEFSVTKNINPICQYNNKPAMLQPTSITLNSDNSRVSKKFLFIFHICKIFNDLLLFENNNKTF